MNDEGIDSRMSTSRIALTEYTGVLKRYVVARVPGA